MVTYLCQLNIISEQFDRFSVIIFNALFYLCILENKFKSWNKFFPHQSQALLKNLHSTQF